MHVQDKIVNILIRDALLICLRSNKNEIRIVVHETKSRRPAASALAYRFSVGP